MPLLSILIILACIAGTLLAGLLCGANAAMGELEGDQ